MAVKPKVPKVKDVDESTVDSPASDLSEFVEIPYRGFTFVIPRDRGDWSTEGLAYLGQEKYNLFVKHTLEIAKPGQWAVLVSMCPRRRDFSDFFTVFGPATEQCIG